jgi:hypothetical protein
VLVGYGAGILHKIFYNMDWVILFYLLNAVMVAVDMVLYFRNSALDRQRDALPAPLHRPARKSSRS